jgi:hypothetical protein
MVSHSSVLALVFTLALTATALPARADEASVPTVTVSAHADAPLCDGATPDDARRIAQQAQREGAHRKAAECFRIAGDHVRADRAQLRASAATGAVSGQKTAANLETAKAQARRIREALR